MYSEKMYGYGAKSSVIREIFSYSQARAALIGKDKVYDYSLGNPSVPAPKEVQEAYRHTLTDMSPLEVHGYTAGPGDMGTRNAIAEDLNERFGTDVTGANIYMTCGAAAALKIAMCALYEEGDELLTLTPFFPEYEVFSESAGYKFKPVTSEYGTFQPDIAKLEEAITEKTKVLLLNSPNNPSGVVYTKEKLKAVARLLQQKTAEYGHQIYIISDEPYRELAYGAEVTFIPKLFRNTIVCYSYSKSLSLPGERIGYVCVQPEMEDADKLYLAVCGAGRALGYVCAPSLAQQVIRQCVKVRPDLQPYIENRNLLYGELTRIGYECIYPDGAFYLCVKAPDGDTERFCEKAKKYDVLMVPGECFAAPGYVRLAYCVDHEMIKRSIPFFEMILEEYRA